MDGEFPEMQVIPIAKLVFHEMEQKRRTEILEGRIRSDGLLKNPVIVGKVGSSGSRYLLLDGVHRVSALKNLGCSYVLAQVVDYFDQQIKVENWTHLILDGEPDRLLAKFREVEGVRLEETAFERAKMLLRKREIDGFLLLRTNKAFAVHTNCDLRTRTRKLAELIGIYYECSIVHRGSEEENISLLRKRATGTAMMIVPRYKKQEIVDLAFGGLRLPPGITRHIIPSRILDFHVGLDFLRANSSLKDKNRRINQKLRRLIFNANVRFYKESVLIFDDW